MESHLIINSFVCINLLVVMQRKLLFIYLKTYLVKKNVISIFAPHLIKTVLNCLSNSGSGHCTRFNSGFFVLIVTDPPYQDLERGLKMLNKLTSDHINLTPFSVTTCCSSSQ